MEKWPKCSLKKVVLEGKTEYYLLTRIENNNHQDITVEVSNGVHSFHGSISAEEMKANQQNSRLDQAEFAKLTLGALTNMESCRDEHFSYSLEENARCQGEWVMTWKKSIPEEDIKFQLGFAKLLAMPSRETVATILDCATNQISELEKEVSTLRREKETLQAEKNDLVVMLKGKVHQKSDLETQLLTKFVVVLNKKKTKIRALKSELQSFQRNDVGEKNDNKDSQETNDIPGNVVMRSQNSSLDSSLQFADSPTDVATTSGHVKRRVRQVRKLPNPSTPPLRKKRTITKSKNSNKGKDSDLEFDTLDLMDKI